MSDEAIGRHLGMIGVLAASLALRDTGGMSDLSRARLLTGLEDIRASLVRLGETITPFVKDDSPLFSKRP